MMRHSSGGTRHVQQLAAAVADAGAGVAQLLLVVVAASSRMEGRLGMELGMRHRQMQQLLQQGFPDTRMSCSRLKGMAVTVG
jgi:hypothetical protein